MPLIPLHRTRLNLAKSDHHVRLQCYVIVRAIVLLTSCLNLFTDAIPLLNDDFFNSCLRSTLSLFTETIITIDIPFHFFSVHDLGILFLAGLGVISMCTI